MNGINRRTFLAAAGVMGANRLTCDSKAQATGQPSPRAGVYCNLPQTYRCRVLHTTNGVEHKVLTAVDFPQTARDYPQEIELTSRKTGKVFRTNFVGNMLPIGISQRRQVISHLGDIDDTDGAFAVRIKYFGSPQNVYWQDATDLELGGRGRADNVQIDNAHINIHAKNDRDASWLTVELSISESFKPVYVAVHGLLTAIPNELIGIGVDDRQYDIEPVQRVVFSSDKFTLSGGERFTNFMVKCQVLGTWLGFRRVQALNPVDVAIVNQTY